MSVTICRFFSDTYSLEAYRPYKLGSVLYLTIILSTYSDSEQKQTFRKQQADAKLTPDK